MLPHKFVIHFKVFCDADEQADFRVSILAAVKAARPVFRSAGVRIRPRITSFGSLEDAAVGSGNPILDYDDVIIAFSATHRPIVPNNDLVVFVVDLVDALNGVACRGVQSPNMLVDKATFTDAGMGCEWVWAHEVAHTITRLGDDGYLESLLFWNPCICTKPPSISLKMREQISKSDYVVKSA
jgi:hypothetical protein